jgi:hypothetical protein
LIGTFNTFARTLAPAASATLPAERFAHRLTLSLIEFAVAVFVELLANLVKVWPCAARRGVGRFRSGFQISISRAYTTVAWTIRWNTGSDAFAFLSAVAVSLHCGTRQRQVVGH